MCIRDRYGGGEKKLKPRTAELTYNTQIIKIDITKPQITIGRTQGDFKINENTVSSRHAVLKLGPESILLSDLGSSEGTYLGYDDLILQCNDVIELGNYQYQAVNLNYEKGSLDLTIIASLDQTTAKIGDKISILLGEDGKVIGKSSQANIIIDDETLADKHAKLHFKENFKITALEPNIVWKRLSLYRQSSTEIYIPHKGLKYEQEKKVLIRFGESKCILKLL
eukprot:TRINITY_DN7817_c0_g1_i1.p1 TRINITY_DN7817_c0_g1~~TRINITY_DN7817_c0_g1_i1.p1  ORF type:complete len:224 (-),score=29.41 TRINITY_DN7817_c0_g1_i1:28-699(-)